MTTRHLAVVLLLSGMAAAPLVSQQSDCMRWLATYRQSLLHSRAAHHLRAAKRRLTHHHPVAHHYATGHRMSPTEALRRFQINCGDLDTPTPEVAAVLPPIEVAPEPSTVEWPADVPPQIDFPPYRFVDLVGASPDDVPPDVPVVGPVFGGTPVGGPVVVPELPGVPVGPSSPGVPVAATPESGTWMLTLTGLGLLLVWRKVEVRA